MGFDTNRCDLGFPPPTTLMLSLSEYEDGNAGSAYGMAARVLPSSYFDRLSMRAKGGAGFWNLRISGLATERKKQTETQHAA